MSGVQSVGFSKMALFSKEQRKLKLKITCRSESGFELDCRGSYFSCTCSITFDGGANPT